MEGVYQSAEKAILYLDDQASHRLLFERSFRGDWLILTTSSASEAIKILKEHDVFLVIADQNMPETTGIDFLTEVKQISPQAVRAILSAYGDADLKKEAFEKAKISAYLEKPWDRHKIRSFIEEAYNRFSNGETIPIKEEPPEKKIEKLINEGSQSSNNLCKLVSQLEARVDERGRKRIILTYSEPRLKNFVVLIRRPCPEELLEAAAAAIVAENEKMEGALLRYLKRLSSEDSAPSLGPTVN
ncbi:MAG: response regulator [Deltaproteobacteria bacterium]|nr:response regulator [Deltaproteobacteria bacterium]